MLILGCTKIVTPKYHVMVGRCRRWVQVLNILQWDCQSSLAGTNEAHRLQLPGVGKRPGNSWPSKSSEGGGSRHSLSIRNKNGREEDRRFEVEARVDELGCERLRREEWWSCNLLEEGDQSSAAYVSQFYIDADVVEKDGFIWRFIGFYGEPKTDRKELSWKALKTLNASRRRPWLCVGDFNEVMLGCEKEVGQPKQQGCMDRFREALNDYELSDLGFVGDPFT